MNNESITKDLHHLDVVREHCSIVFRYYLYIWARTL